MLSRIPWRYGDRFSKVLAVGAATYVLSWHERLSNLQIAFVVGWLVVHILVSLAPIAEPVVARRAARRHPDCAEWVSLLRHTRRARDEAEAEIQKDLNKALKNHSQHAREFAFREVVLLAREDDGRMQN